MIDYLRQDLRFAARQLRKAPGFTTAAVLTLALGIGANLTVFLILYGALLRPLPFPHPEQLVRVERFWQNFGLAPAYSATRVLFFERANRTLDSVAAYDFVPSNVNMEQGSEAVPLKDLRVTANFFHVLQMEPKLGRSFSAADGVPNAPGVVVLSDATWRSRFQADPNILGRAITLGNQRYTVIGVASPALRMDAKVDLWTPLQFVENAADHVNAYNVIARLKSGVSRSAAQADLERVNLELKSVYPDLWDQGEGLRVLDYHDSLTGEIRPVLQMLMGAVALVLLIVTANILSLLLTRSIARRREMSLRAALGASAWRVLRQLLVENALLCFIGGLFGVMAAEFAAPALLRLSPIPLPEFTNLLLGASALWFALGLTVVCALLFSLVPALEARRAQLTDSLRQNSAQIAVGRNLPQKALVIGEVATSLVLLIAAALLLNSFWRLSHVAPGFDSANVVTFKTAFSPGQTSSTASLGRLSDQLITRLEAVPGVQSVAAVVDLPTQIIPELPFDIMGRPAGLDGSGGEEKYVPISAHYFDALQIPILAGRALAVSDTHGTQPVIVVNQQFARTYFRGQNAIGQHIHIGAAMGPSFEDGIREIVGVVGDTRNSGLDKPAPPLMYLPM